MAYVPKLLMISRCRRCGKKLYRGDLFYYCENCGAYYCPICYKKTHGRCAACNTVLVEG